MTSVFSLSPGVRAGDPRMSKPRRQAMLIACMLACLPGIALWPAQATADDKFVAVVATDGYAELKQQIRWEIGRAHV